jgi:hypothetical protein
MSLILCWSARKLPGEAFFVTRHRVVGLHLRIPTQD